ncbi:uncharacterized protein LOC117526697 [Thalassophryne amazonica]|uniref:uncharacterized protein LOC117526697 n=1 Tax=Thalassophryne amazonica TaxID=390379 RepID=UPI0014712B25|nr:uncharacterized protein LOC117526697 [Thalassophryne amazonica]
MSEGTILRLVQELSNRLNLLLKEISTTDMNGFASHVQDLFHEATSPALTQENLEDPNFIRLWFRVKLLPLLPQIPLDLLSCLSTKNFTCPVFQTIVAELSREIQHMDGSQTYGHQIYKYFIYSFLRHHNTSQPQCVSSGSHSAEWLISNFGFFARFASVVDFYSLNPNFSGLEALHVLTPKQVTEMLVLSLQSLADKEAAVRIIFEFLLESPVDRKFPQVLEHLVNFAKEGNLSCSSYKALFARFDLVTTTVSLDIAVSITLTTTALSKQIPPGCSLYRGECNVTSVNETAICVNVNSTLVQSHLDSGHIKGRLCNFSVEEFACASLSALTAEDLAVLIKCNRSFTGSRTVWKLLLSKASAVLENSLDLLASMTLDPRHTAVSLVLDAVREIRLDASTLYNDSDFIQLWFNRRLRPFLPAMSTDFLSCLSTKNLSCSTYQDIVQILSGLQMNMSFPLQMSIYTNFIKGFLTRNETADPGCSMHPPNSGEWIKENLGGFSALLSFNDLQMLHPNFNVMEALPQLTVRQLAEVASTPGQLTSPAQVTIVTDHIPNHLLAAFFDDLSAGIMSHETVFPAAVRSAMLQVVYDRANLSDHSVSDSVVSVWLQKRLLPLLVSLSPQHVMPFFKILARRNCSIEQQGIKILNSTIATLGGDTKREIYNHIIWSLKGK